MTLVANADGQISGKFTIPAGVPVGSQLVTFESAADTEGYATFVGRGQITTREMRLINTRRGRGLGGQGGTPIPFWGAVGWGNVGSGYSGSDPLAQTFMVAREQQIVGIEIWLTDKGITPVTVHIREASLGLPTSTVLAESQLVPAAITRNDWTYFPFTPTVLQPNTEYAIVVMCDDNVSAVATAGLGEFDAAEQQYVTVQPYQVGVLLSSSNNLTWTAHQTKDLTFRLFAPVFSLENQSRTIPLDPINVVDADQLLVLAAVERPTEECDVLFHITAGAKTYTITEAQPLQLDTRFTGQITWSAELLGAADATPILYRQIQVLAGKRLGTGDYISRAIDTKVGPTVLTVTITAYFDALLPGGSSVVVTAQDGEDWLAMPVIATEDQGNGWVEYRCEIEDVTMLETRIKLDLTGTDRLRPRVRNLRVAIT